MYCVVGTRPKDRTYQNCFAWVRFPGGREKVLWLVFTGPTEPCDL